MFGPIRHRHRPWPPISSASVIGLREQRDGAVDGRRARFVFERTGRTRQGKLEANSDILRQNPNPRSG